MTDTEKTIRLGSFATIVGVFFPWAVGVVTLGEALIRALL